MAVTTRQSPTTATDDSFAPANLVWHYTCAPAAALIGQDGFIRAHPDRAASSNHSIIWFADRNTYEPTAARMRRIPMDCRFGVRRALTVPWPELPNSAGMSWAERKALEKKGRAQGANPALWRGIVGMALDARSTVFQAFHHDEWHTNDLQMFSRDFLSLYEVSFGPFSAIAGTRGAVGRQLMITERATG